MGIFKKNLWLSFSLAKAGFKLRNEGSYLGILWYLLDPLIMFLIFFSVRGLVGKGIENYPLYLLLGLIMFNFFRKTTSYAVKAITINSGLIKSLNVNQTVFVVAIVLQSSFSHFFEVILFVIFAFIFKIQVLNILFYALIFIFFLLFVLGVSFIIATIGVYVGDFGRIWTLLTRLIWFVTPIFYSSKLELPFNINPLNPLYYFITVAREIMIYNRFPELWLIFGMIFFSIISILYGIYTFNKHRNKFAEKI